MILKIFKAGMSNGSSPVRYLLGKNDHKGDERAGVEILEGNPDTTIQIIDSIQRQIKYTSGCLAFAKNEEPDKQQLHKIIDSFKQTFYAGLNGDNFNSLFVLHREPHGMHVHFLLPSKELTTGRKLNPHPPGKRNIEFFETFTKVSNAEMRYAQIKPDPYKLGFSAFEQRSHKGLHERTGKLNVHQAIVRAVKNGKIQDRDGLCEFLQAEFNVEITRRGRDYISVKFPGDTKAKRYRGELYQANVNYRSVLQKVKNEPPTFIQPAELIHLKNKLNQFAEERKAFNTKAYLTPVTLRSKAVQRNRITPKTITTRSNIMNQIFLPVMKRIIADALAVARERVSDAQSEVPVSERKTASDNIGKLRKKAEAATDGDFLAASGGADFHSLNMSIGEVEGSMNSAARAIGSAKTPEEAARLRERMIKLSLQLEKLHQQLHLAKLRASFGDAQSSHAKLKI